MLTFRIVARIPLAVPRDLVADLEHDDPPFQGNGEPSAAARHATDALPKLQLRNLGTEGIVPEDDLVGRIAGAAAATKEE